MNPIGIRCETKSPWERRTPLVPAHVAPLVEAGVDIRIQPSASRAFAAEAYEAAGATMMADLADCPVVLGVKEMADEAFRRDAAYLFFSHTIKAQAYNLPMLRRLMDAGATLVDYERIVDEDGRRLIGFSRFAGMAGMIDSLWTLGRRLAWEGIESPFATLKPAHAYAGLAAVREALHEVGRAVSDGGVPEALRPLVVGIAGRGTVSRGAQEILAELPDAVGDAGRAGDDRRRSRC